MAETKTQAKTSLRDKASVRWLALVLASLAIFGAYYFNYAMSPVKGMLESALGWTSSDFGTYTSAYGWFNVFLFMLIISGIILDKLGVRKTGIGATLIVFLGTFINYWAIVHKFPEGSTIFGLKAQVFWASFGFAIFGVGTEAIGITISKAIVRWFKGKELALAMGMQMAIARLGSALALAISAILARNHSIDTPIAFALVLMFLGIVSFLIFTVLDIKLDQSLSETEKLSAASEEDEFRISDIGTIITNKGFWYIALLCVLFYSAVFPFMFYATDLMINKYQVDPSLAGMIPALLPFGTILLTPLFGGIYDKYGKGATIMIIGSLILILVHFVLFLPFVRQWWVAVVMVIILGVGFSLVPSAMWPSVPKIIPEKQLGTAYAVIFWIQNIGLLSIPLLLGFVLDKTNPDVAPNKQLIKSNIETVITDYAKTINLDEKKTNVLIEKISSATIDSVVKYANYEPEDFDKEQFSNDLKTELSNALAKLDNPNEKQILNVAKDTAYKVITKYKVNLVYDYFYDMLIFLTLSILSLIFAILLKMEDKKKGYGLELPNIKKE